MVSPKNKFLTWFRAYGNMFFAFSILIIVTGCSTYGLGLQSFFVESGVMQYYIPQTKWKGKNASAIPDFTFRQSNLNGGAVCNVTFTLKKHHPRTVNSVMFIADDCEYAIQEISPMFREHSAKSIRVSMRINDEHFIQILASKSLKIFAVIDDLEYEFYPSMVFMRNKNELYENIF